MTLSQVLLQPPPLLALAHHHHHHRTLSSPAGCPSLSVVDDHLFAPLDKEHPMSATTRRSPFADSVQSSISPQSGSVTTPDGEANSPSPVEMSAGAFAHHHFSGSASSLPAGPDLEAYRMANLTTERYLRGSDKYSHPSHHYPLLDQRRMSDPAMYGTTTGTYPTHPSSDLAANRYHLFHNNHSSYTSPRSYPFSLHRTPSLDSSSSDQLPISAFDHPVDIDQPLSPLNPSFSGGASPNMGLPGISTLHEDYGPSPPGTGTSSSSNPMATRQYPLHDGGSPPSSKQYSFVSLPGNAVKKRPRRRYDEIERLYQCNWPNCTKAYGTLNHLNAHVTMQKHGSKRSPNEFKELRKQWRKAKKEEADARTLNALSMRQAPQHHPHRHLSRESLSDTDYPPYHTATHHTVHPDQFPQTPSSADLHESVYHRDLYARRQRYNNGYIQSSTATSGPTYNTHALHHSSIPMNRLPANSTLLTPPAGYEPAPLGSVNNADAYGPYELYASDSRPDSSHGSVGSYDERRRGVSYIEDGRPRSTHLGLGSAHGSDY